MDVLSWVLKRKYSHLCVKNYIAEINLENDLVIELRHNSSLILHQ